MTSGIQLRFQGFQKDPLGGTQGAESLEQNLYSSPARTCQPFASQRTQADEGILIGRQNALRTESNQIFYRGI
jgi:hypothetical protein